jgi:hypothetical protein
LEGRKKLEIDRVYLAKSRNRVSGGNRRIYKEGTAMRRNSIITLLAVVVIGAGLKLALLSTPPARAVPAFKSGGLDIQQTQQNVTNLPVQKIHDMTFVFSAD